MRWINDTTGRFLQRPHYAPNELDSECERVMRDFLVGRYGDFRLPVSTEDLIRLIERETAELDVYADLSGEGPNVEGLTVFQRGAKPLVAIAKELTEDERRQNRYRTTLSHEFGHVHFHDFVFNLEKPEPLFPEMGDELWRAQLARLGPKATAGRDDRQRCKRETIEDASEYDWLEWQAGHVCGALLMPITPLTARVGELKEKLGLVGTVGLGAPAARQLIAAVAAAFEVSQDAARVRLTKLEHLGRTPGATPFEIA